MVTWSWQTFTAPPPASPMTAGNIDLDDDLRAHVNGRLGARQQWLSTLDRKSVKKIAMQSL